ncbi:hypothetical protein TNCV_5089341 [Trichonephila clavipes]|nr:hypothetical protein TNCV_5089341 [Trichonephila clavipes]
MLGNDEHATPSRRDQKVKNFDKHRETATNNFSHIYSLMTLLVSGNKGRKGGCRPPLSEIHKTARSDTDSVRVDMGNISFPVTFVPLVWLWWGTQESFYPIADMLHW